MVLQSLEGDNHLCVLEKVEGKVQVVERKGKLEGRRAQFLVKQACVLRSENA